ncbi:hypothetical protein K7X08_023749 [Anisodus acutangulus]|uniref:Uncharacterized protein n=1 Tax=Anisodus acutangulus TaxID=402998 RepID=A0A9Q1LAW0_9SOLA|nr:hypothetical protein K7X08_023749 [Anisodus acutangulus]
MLEKATVRRYGIYFSSLVTRLCRLAKVPEKKSDIVPPAEPLLQPNKMSICKELVEVDNSEGSDDDNLEDSPEEEEMDVHIAALVQTSQGVRELFSSTLEEKFVLLEGEIFSDLYW